MFVGVTRCPADFCKWLVGDAQLLVSKVYQVVVGNIGENPVG